VGPPRGSQWFVVTTSRCSRAATSTRRSSSCACAGYKLSYRDLAVMMLERGISVALSAIVRWVQRYVPQFEKRLDRFSRPVGRSWRVDETYILVKRFWTGSRASPGRRGELQRVGNRGIAGPQPPLVGQSRCRGRTAPVAESRRSTALSTPCSRWRLPAERQLCSGSGHSRSQRELTVSATFRSSRRQRDRDADDRTWTPPVCQAFSS
jgi:hypothetical protein